MVEVAKQAEEPIDLVHMSLKEKVFVKCKFGRELRGKLVVRNHLGIILIIVSGV